MVANLKDRIKNGELNLSSCGLKEIPLKEIASLKHAVSLNLSNNKIASIPKGLGNLTHLVKLDLSKNQIKGIPDGIGNLTNLKQLNLARNQLATLPASLGNLKNLKHLDLSNNPLAQKFSELVGPCQNENQCQQAARNVVKAFSTQSDTDKKKKQKDSEPELKKKKNDKKAQNGGITQNKQKDRKQKKADKGFFLSFIGNIFFLLKTSFYAAFLLLLIFYLTQFVNENRYKYIKSEVAPYLHSGLTRVLSEENTAKVEAGLVQAEATLNRTVVTGVKYVITRGKQAYTYVLTDPTIRSYVTNAKVSINELWSKLTSSGSGEQKS